MCLNIGLTAFPYGFRHRLPDALFFRNRGVRSKLWQRLVLTLSCGVHLRLAHVHLKVCMYIHAGALGECSLSHKVYLPSKVYRASTLLSSTLPYIAVSIYSRRDGIPKTASYNKFFRKTCVACSLEVLPSIPWNTSLNDNVFCGSLICHRLNSYLDASPLHLAFSESKKHASRYISAERSRNLHNLFNQPRFLRKTTSSFPSHRKWFCPQGWW